MKTFPVFIIYISKVGREEIEVLVQEMNLVWHPAPNAVKQLTGINCFDVVACSVVAEEPGHNLFERELRGELLIGESSLKVCVVQKLS